jgi:hypothetical protein
MYKKIIEYTDYDGNQRKETFYFNFSKAELSEMEMSAVGGFANQIQKIVDEHDNKRIIELFKDIILKSYGEKSADGKHFVKSPELSTAFSQTEAYSELFMELSSNTDSATAFINGIIPQIATLPPSNN